MHYVYILKSMKDGRTYTGHAKDVAARFFEHSRGKVKATRSRRPLNLLYAEGCESLTEAKRREIYWKSGAGRRKLRVYFIEGFPPIPKEWARLASL